MRDMPNVREIDGVRHCLVEEGTSQALYSPCEQPLTQSMLGPGIMGLILFLALIVFLAPQIDYRKSRVDGTLNRAKRSLS